MDLNAVMDDVATKLGTLTGLNVFAYPPPTITPPAVIVSYPERVEYDQTYGRGLTRVSGLPVVVLEGKATDRSARKRIAAYVSDQGAKSVKLVLEDTASESWDDLTVASADFDVITIAGVDYIAALFTCNLACQGTPSS
jgi:hypothetical protein